MDNKNKKVEPEKKERYRKPKSKVKRDHVISFKANPVEWNFIRTMAKLEGITLSEYIRSRAMKPGDI